MRRRPVSEVPPTGLRLKCPPDAPHAATCKRVGFRSSPGIMSEYAQADGGSSWLPLVLHQAKKDCVSLFDLNRPIGAPVEAPSAPPESTHPFAESCQRRALHARRHPSLPGLSRSSANLTIMAMNSHVASAPCFAHPRQAASTLIKRDKI